MKLIATIANAAEQYDVHLEVPDDEAGRARIADALHEMQERFVPRSTPQKKSAARTTTTPPRPQTQPTMETHRDT